MSNEKPKWMDDWDDPRKVQWASEKIVCKTCKFRPCESNEDEDDEEFRLDRADTANCLIYTDEDKPNAVYFDGASCKYYEYFEWGDGFFDTPEWEQYHSFDDKEEYILKKGAPEWLKKALADYYEKLNNVFKELK